MCWPVCQTGCFARSLRVQPLKQMGGVPLNSLTLSTGSSAALQGCTGLQGAALLMLLLMLLLPRMLLLRMLLLRMLLPRMLPLPWLVLLKRRKALETRPFPGLSLRLRRCDSMPVVRLGFLQRYRLHPLGWRPATDLRRLAGGAS